MTEDEWLAGEDPSQNLDFLKGKASDRKHRLFACACCRSLWTLLADERGKAAIEASEAFADGSVSKAALKSARQAVRAARYGLKIGDGLANERWAAYWLAEVAASENAFTSVAAEIGRFTGLGILRPEGDWRPRITSLLKDVFGNPFRPISLSLHVPTDEVVGLAREIYGVRAFGRMPELADALEAAGCGDAEILGHCRGQEGHVRGCWVVDLLLGLS
jgi:hypothetical protein